MGYAERANPNSLYNYRRRPKTLTIAQNGPLTVPGYLPSSPWKERLIAYVLRCWWGLLGLMAD